MSKDKDDDSKFMEFTVAPAITAFLKPIGETTGKEIATQIKLYIEEKRSKKREMNLQQHLLRVNKTRHAQHRTL